LDGSIKIWPPTGTTPTVSLDVTKFTSVQIAGAGGDKSDIVSISKPSASSGGGGGGTTAAASAGMKKDQAGLPYNNEMLGKSGKVINMWVDHTCERYSILYIYIYIYILKHYILVLYLTIDSIWAACGDASLKLWSGCDMKPLRILKGHEAGITAMEGLSANDSSNSGLQVSNIVATGSKDQTIRVWDPRMKKGQCFLFRGHSDTILALRWFASFFSFFL
jgi:WD40 repeat protein